MSAWSVKPTWPEGTIAPTEDFLAWFLLLDDTEQLAIMFTLREAQKEAGRCFQMDHAGLQEHNRSQADFIRKLHNDKQALIEKISALNDIIVRAYRECTCGTVEVKL
jgi:hypothetical protein